ncbi:hypothetical protein [Paenibacillus sp. IHBB 10380]|uniref:hypothetical protein n=1 Tax=Paenibacillus sp. IHBB 10380 TaxID=1566358 RepID=UPI001184965C|nr:hypothetical protein [Paenibacillus sp. IHBB 10380]
MIDWQYCFPYMTNHTLDEPEHVPHDQEGLYSRRLAYGQFFLSHDRILLVGLLGKINLHLFSVAHHSFLQLTALQNGAVQEGFIDERISELLITATLQRAGITFILIVDKP